MSGSQLNIPSTKHLHNSTQLLSLQRLLILKIMKRFTLNTFILSLLCIGLSFNALAQISEGGTPQSFINKNIGIDNPVVILDKPDMDQIRIEDEHNPVKTRPRVGVSVLVNKGIHNAGTWTELDNGDQIWRLKLSCPDALALGVYFDDFYLPEGGELYLYNENKKQVLGAYTQNNNHSSGLFATQLVQGDKVTLEYYQPAYVTGHAIINISELSYTYRFVDFAFSNEEDRSSWWCMINVNCEEGDDWQDEKRGVVKQYMKVGWGYYLCSGSLINTTDWSRDPYVLTAAHCGFGASSSDLNQWIFYFNYEAPSCNGTTGPQNQTVTGASLKAWDHFSSIENIDDSDFYLVLLNSNVPSGYNPYYNGWDRRDVPGEEGVSIHHPNGDIKKISTYEQMVSSTFWTGKPTHWMNWWAETENGRSITQGGSSGSPIFNQDKRIIGDLTGGYASNSCDNPSPSFYGKVYWSWDKAGTSAAFRLKDWLDPIESGDTVCDGIPHDAIPPACDFEADTTDIMQGDTVYFTDLTTNKPQYWKWLLDGAHEDTVFVQNPVAIYSDTGWHDVKLIVENPDGMDSLTMEDYIYVGAVAPPLADFGSDTSMIEPYGSIDFFDESEGEPYAWLWTFEGGTPSSSDEQNPEQIKYYASGLYDVKLVVTNAGGQDSITKTDYVNVVWVGLDENKLLQNVKLFPNPTSGNLFLEIENLEIENAELKIYNMLGEKMIEFDNIRDENRLQINLGNQHEGIYFIVIEINDTKIVQRVSLIK